jgi:hypothetical protein
MRLGMAIGFGWVLLWTLDCSGNGDEIPDDAGSTEDAATTDDATATDDATEAYCPDGATCAADFPCGMMATHDPNYLPHCDGASVVLPVEVSCEEVCGTPCCMGGSCRLETTPCPAGQTCEMVAGAPTCLGACGVISTFADTGTTLRDVFVSPSGSDDTGDGSDVRPFATLGRALRDARPGDHVILSDGTNAGDIWAEGVQGTEANPIVIDGGGTATISGGAGGIQLVDPAYVVIQGLTITGQSGNGINIDDGGDYATPAHHVVVRDVNFTNIGPGGNNDCLKLSGLDDFFVLDNAFTGCGVGGDGSGIDMVGCHDGTIARNYFFEMGANSVQAKGGSARVTIRANMTRDGGVRAFNLGGSTGLEFFRPLGTDYEARDIRAVANLIDGSEAAVAFVGCDACLAANNTIIRPTRWVARILQESVTGFVPCRNGRFVNNLVVFRRADLSTFVNVGPDTAPDTFTFSNNLWFAEDDPTFAGPDLPVTETGTIVADPWFVDGPGSDYHLLAGSPADGAGMTLTEVTADFAGNCYQDPPAIGAFESI